MQQLVPQRYMPSIHVLGVASFPADGDPEVRAPGMFRWAAEEEHGVQRHGERGRRVCVFGSRAGPAMSAGCWSTGGWPKVAIWFRKSCKAPSGPERPNRSSMSYSGGAFSASRMYLTTVGDGEA